MGTKNITTILSEPCPCDGCKLRAECAAEGLACLYFSRYVTHNGEYTKPLAPIPNRRYYDDLYAWPTGATT